MYVRAISAIARKRREIELELAKAEISRRDFRRALVSLDEVARLLGQPPKRIIRKPVMRLVL